MGEDEGAAVAVNKEEGAEEGIDAVGDIEGIEVFVGLKEVVGVAKGLGIMVEEGENDDREVPREGKIIKGKVSSESPNSLQIILSIKYPKKPSTSKFLDLSCFVLLIFSPCKNK